MKEKMNKKIWKEKKWEKKKGIVKRENLFSHSLFFLQLKWALAAKYRFTAWARESLLCFVGGGNAVTVLKW